MSDTGGSDPTLAGSLSGPPSTASSSHLKIELGVTRVGRYLVLEELGRGGMGVVYAALDPELDRKVAVKVLKRWDDGVEGSQGHKRLLREAQAMARLKHPNVVTVHDAGIHEGRVFVAFELVEGATLTAWLKAKRRGVPEILDVFVQAGRGLAAAHAKELVHRDFKPDNVMIELAESGPIARVMDFGLARVAGGARPIRDVRLSSSDSFAGDLTQHGRVVGTPRYMSPEQHLSNDTDARTDQFAFCVALWEALDGKHPFGGETMAELVTRVVAGARRAPSPEGRLKSRIRRALERGLAADPANRWPSLDALLEVLAYDPSRTRRRVLVAAGVVIALGGAFGVERTLHAKAVELCRRRGVEIQAVWNDDARAQLGEQVRASGIAHSESTFERLVPWLDAWAIRWQGNAETACLAGDVEGRWSESTAAKANGCLDERREVLVGLLEGLAPPEAATLGAAISAAAELPRPEECIDERHLVLLPNVDAAEGEHARELRGRLARAWGAADVGRHVDADAAAESILGDAEGPTLARIRIEAVLLRATVAHTRADYERALELHREAFASALEHDAPDLALEGALGSMTASGLALARTEEGLAWEPIGRALLRRLGEERSRRGARLLQHVGTIRHRQANYEPARELLTAALEIRRELVGDDHPGLEPSLEALARLELDLANYDRATELVTQLVELQERVYGPDHPSVAQGIGLMGLVHDARGDYTAAEALHRRSLAIREAAYGPAHPFVGGSLSNIAMAMMRRGDNAGALPLLERAVAIFDAALGHDHPDLIGPLLNLANVQHNLERYEDAIASYRRGLEIARAKLGADHSTVGVALVNLANTTAVFQRIDEAIRYQKEAIEIFERRYGPDHLTVATGLMNLGQLLIRKEEHEPALVPLERALAIIERVVGRDHPDAAYALIGIAEAQLGLGRRAEALVAAERVLAIRESSEVSPDELANARFTLAKAVDDPTRARALAEQALAGFETMESGMADTVKAWLRAHQPG